MEAIIGDSMVSGLKEELFSNKKHQVKVRCCRSVTVEDMFNYVKPISKTYVLLHVGTNNAKDVTSRKILGKLFQLKAAVLDSHENCKIILSQPMTRMNDGKAYLTISKLNDLLKKADIPVVKIRNITADYCVFDSISLDILMISETKLDESFPVSQFLIPGFENPIHLDRSSSGGGIILHIREGIPFKLLRSNRLSANTKAFLVEVKINKNKKASLL